MARALPAGTAVREARILTEQYMAELAQLCTITKPTETDIANIFLKEFRRALGRGMARPSVRAEAAASKAKSPSSPTKSPTKSKGSKKRGGK
ncbi:hypothetical protein HPB50_015163 [Hyalomma asiaticum]|uniref:Uncharacterized protein n=1 Tax=Hyalomma asiaticum TaxID=266040 RepID=A0ACB7RMB7_HYAAI|nr:hypothetical protein HPB50_015163 [Hyalomma asiaticum]